MPKLIAGNWKMNLAVEESISLISGITEKLNENKKAEIAVFPPFTSLQPVADFLKGGAINIFLGAQNMHFEKSGAFTGEISPLMLKEIGCKYAIIGHSERRQYFNEDDKLVNKKLKSAIENKLIPILCVGENLGEREAGKQNEIVRGQLTNGLDNIKINKNNVVFAYEPVWAIGTGKTATPEQAEEMHAFIRKVLKDNFKEDKVRVIYGGSVNEKNAKELLKQKNIDGALAGGASLKAESFVKIVESC